MSAMASQITSLTIVNSIVHSGADQRKHQSSASLVFVRGIHRSPVNSPHKWPVTWKVFPFDDVIMIISTLYTASSIQTVVAHILPRWHLYGFCYTQTARDNKQHAEISKICPASHLTYTWEANACIEQKHISVNTVPSTQFIVPLL